MEKENQIFGCGKKYEISQERDLDLKFSNFSNTQISKEVNYD